MSKSGIYQILNTVDGHRYIGSAVSLAKRWINHRASLRRGDHRNVHLQRAWNKYGEAAFELRVIGMCPPADLIRMEQHLLDDMRPEYNISPTAGSSLGIVSSPETRAKLSLVNKGRKNGPFSTEHRANLSAAKKGKRRGPPSPEHRAKISASNKGKTQSPEHRAKISAAKKGKTHSPETRAKMSEAHRGKTHSPEARVKLSIANKGKRLSPETRAKMSKAHLMRSKNEQNNRIHTRT